MPARGSGLRGSRHGARLRHPGYLNEVEAISKNSIRRLARRGGVKRISGPNYDEIRGTLKMFLEKVIPGAATYAQYGKRNTIKTMDVLYALKKQGHTLYGYGG